MYKKYPVRCLSEGEIDLARQRRGKGDSFRKIAKELFVSETTVRRALYEEKVVNKTKPLSGEEIDWAYQKWLEGYTQREIAKALFVNERAVQKVLGEKKKIWNESRPELVYEGRATNEG